MGEKELFDVTIIGGGTTGLFATYYATMRNLKVKLIESQDQFGGKVMQFFPEKLIYDIGGYPDISGDALVKQMVQQASRHQPVMLTKTWIETIEKADDHFVLETLDGARHFTKAVVLATGSGTFHTKKPKNWDDLPFPAYRDIVATNLMDEGKYEGKDVVIASNNRQAIVWALHLEGKAKSVTIVNENDKLQQTREEDIQQLENSDAIAYNSATITNLVVDNQQLTAVEIKDHNKQEVRLKADYMLAYYGLALQATPFDAWDVALNKGRIPVKGDMATSVPGIFAAGDVVQYEGKTNLIAAGYTEAITAVNKAHKFIDPSVTEQLYSTVLYRK
ncbi:NAD(P)/FAD-dependent oxidoreductase [Gracilibacillus caseinilyticus]|uniref:Ferredoxin--NADP reductase n=1 Tax=Gracilibacillus caseinilyticus TaxID=2932256 RepID=A0ABY4EY51_9BACI|nr:NAD(P)/FAD-dependent oxidoreductase [Gracilibacillus caseinilyticus]UOQ49204.1 NAD(P)/FAD-dependent oxidoreductase [Gracilibacillus caseinilyticus]